MMSNETPYTEKHWVIMNKPGKQILFKIFKYPFQYMTRITLKFL